MTRKKKLKISEDSVETRFANWTAQLLAIMMPWSLYWVAGRASAKTVQVLAERVQEAAQDCPGAPFAWVADTYSDLHKNVIPSLIDGLQLLGWELGTHYVINEAPPEEWRLRMYNVCTDWRNTMVFTQALILPSSLWIVWPLVPDVPTWACLATRLNISLKKNSRTS